MTVERMCHNDRVVRSVVTCSRVGDWNNGIGSVILWYRHNVRPDRISAVGQ